MTLPFRRRHHDDDGPHDRARALSSSRLVEALDPDETAWLARHLESCTECSREDEAFVADRELLRSLRDKPIEPPRDLWARTAAALDREGGKRFPTDARARAPRPPLPVGAAAGVLILLVVAATALLPGILPPKAPSATDVAAASGAPGPTPTPTAAE